MFLLENVSVVLTFYVLLLSILVSGNLLGPFINTTTEGGLEKLIRMPTGSGENVMIYLAPNVYVLEYLSKTKQLTRANEQKAYRFIQYGTHTSIFITLG